MLVVTLFNQAGLDKEKCFMCSFFIQMHCHVKIIVYRTNPSQVLCPQFKIPQNVRDGAGCTYDTRFQFLKALYVMHTYLTAIQILN